MVHDVKHAVISMTLLCTAVFYAGYGADAAMSEHDAVMAALQGNAQIRISQIDRAADSLEAKAQRAQWYPGVTLDATASYDPIPPASDINAGIAAVQTLPGGATLKAGADGSYSSDMRSSGYEHGTVYNFEATQPLLAKAWGNASQDVATRIQRLDRQAFNLQQRKSLASNLSDIRSAYWDCYAGQRGLQIAANSLKYAEEQTGRVRARYSVGTASAIDTMSAVLEQLKARSALLNAQTSYTRSRDALGRALGRGSDAVSVPESLDVAVDGIPDAPAFLAEARRWDPDMAIFETLRSKLEIQIRQQRNGLLPQLDAQAGYSISRTFDSPTRSGTFKDDGVVKLIFSYALPLTQRNADLAQMRLSMAQNDIRAQDRAVELGNQVGELVQSWNLEREQLGIAVMARDLARLQLAATAKGYELGTVDRLSLIKAQDDYVSASLSCLQQQITLKRLEIVFDETTGTVFKKFGVQLQ